MGDFKRRSTDQEGNAFADCPRYDKHELSEDQIETIAERAAKKAIDYAKSEFYQDVGHTVMGKLYWLIGVVVVGIVVGLAKLGWIRIGG